MTIVRISYNKILNLSIYFGIQTELILSYEQFSKNCSFQTFQVQINDNYLPTGQCVVRLN